MLRRARVFFLLVNLKSAREPQFFKNVHGHVFAFTGTFWKSSRASFCVHGHIFWKSSRVSFCVHGQIFGSFTGTFHGSRAPVLEKFHGHFLRFTGTFSSKNIKMLDFLCFCGLFAGSRAHFPSSRALFLKNVHGHF